MDINEWITFSVKQNASDLHLCSGYPPMWRIDGELQPIQTSVCCNAAQLERWGDSWMTAHKRQHYTLRGRPMAC